MEIQKSQNVIRCTKTQGYVQRNYRNLLQHLRSLSPPHRHSHNLRKRPSPHHRPLPQKVWIVLIKYHLMSLEDILLYKICSGELCRIYGKFINLCYN